LDVEDKLFAGLFVASLVSVVVVVDVVVDDGGLMGTPFAWLFALPFCAFIT